jgi:ABC-type amino acid transport substrate-binding protein
MTWAAHPEVMFPLHRSSSVYENETSTSVHGQVQRRDVNNRKLIVTTILEEPYMMMKERSAFLAGNDRFEGYLADILQRLATSVGFEYETRLCRDGKYGEPVGPDGAWDGMIGEVQTGEADIAAGPLIATDALRQAVDFTEPFLSLRWSALIRRPDLPVGGRRGPGTARPGTATTNRLTSAAQLLHRSSDLVFGVVENSVAQQQLATSADPTAQALWQRLLASSSRSRQGGSTRGVGGGSDPFVRSVQEGVDRARRERYAFLLESPMAEYIASREPCDLYTVEPFLDVATYAFALRKRQPPTSSGEGDIASSGQLHRLRQAIDREMRRMKSSGEMQTMYLRWWRDECGLTPPSPIGSGGTRRGSETSAAAGTTNDQARRHTSSGARPQSVWFSATGASCAVFLASVGVAFGCRTAPRHLCI